MAKLYAMSHKTGSQTCQYKLPLLSPLAALKAHECGSAHGRTNYSLTVHSLTDSGEYELHQSRSDYSCAGDSVSQRSQMQHVLDQATALCNELEELTALHYSFYEAVEAVFNRDSHLNGKECCSRAGLSLFPDWLRERDLNALDAVQKLQQSLRQCCRKNE